MVLMRAENDWSIGSRVVRMAVSESIVVADF